MEAKHQLQRSDSAKVIEHQPAADAESVGEIVGIEREPRE
jgi:hypothetical protein